MSASPVNGSRDAEDLKRKRYVPATMFWPQRKTTGDLTSFLSFPPLHPRSPSPSAPKDRAVSPPLQRRRSISPPSASVVVLPRVSDVDPARRRERERQLALRLAEEELAATTTGEQTSTAVATTGGGFDSAAEFAKLMQSSRSGGAYVPPARLRAMQMEASKDKASAEFQRLSWDALRKSINGLINKVCL